MIRILKSLRIGAVATAAAVLAGLALVTTGAGVASATTTSTLNLTYSCTFPLIGTTTVPVVITGTNIPNPVTHGQPTPTFPVTLMVTAPSNATSGLNLVGAATVSGSVALTMSFVNGNKTVTTDVPMTIPGTTVPPSGAFVVTAAGTAPSETLPNTGTANITVGNFSATLTPLDDEGDTTSLGTFTVNCTLSPASQNTILETITVN